jgi:tRNA (5-methylaminomethyl-2-thiouridylate)-methyltransferase
MIPRRSVQIFILICELCSAFVSQTNVKIFASQRHRRAYPTSDDSSTSPSSLNDNATTSALDQALQQVSQQFQGLPIGEIQRKLVQEGARFQKQLLQEQALTVNPKESSQHDYANTLNSSDYIISNLQRVPACISNLHVQTILRRTADNAGYRVSLQGTSDSLLSRGLLAVVATVLNEQLVDQVLQLNVDSVADSLSLRKALSRGRNDGLAGIVRIVQSQMREVLEIAPTRSSNNQENVTPPSASTDNVQVLPIKAAPTVALLLSGGVDSSVALHLLKQQGYNVTAFYLKIWLQDELAHLGSHCPFEDDILMCQAVCDQAGVPLEQISLQREYQDRVISYTLQEARQGRTPNPDIMCNSRIKFGCFYDAIASRGFDHVATGHYAQLIQDKFTNQVRLLRAPDPVKDQSYFLCALTQDQLQRVLFPIGHLQKAEVRQLAEEFQLPNRQRPDSQGLCFLGKVKFDQFIKSYLGDMPGDIIDASTGEILGEHRGVWYHTVGQRKGIGNVLKPLATSRGPWYVVAKDPERNILYCSNLYEESMFHAARSDFTVENIQWFANSAPVCDAFGQCRLLMKIRHGPKIDPGTLHLNEDGRSGKVRLDEKDGGLAPGQFVVFYRDEECLGGGVISERHITQFLLNQLEFGASTTSLTEVFSGNSVALTR